MSKFERLLLPGSTEMPDCQCGTEMRLVRSERKSPNTEVRIYECFMCKRELRLMTWIEAGT
jgi:predicted SprT family Zn-dependent metalloprotease